MIDIRVRVEPDTKQLQNAVNEAAFKNFTHGAASIRKAAQGLIDKAPLEPPKGRRRKGPASRRRVRRTEAGPAGRPIRTRRGRARAAILYDVSEEGAIIGPRFSVVGESFAAHEFGERYMGQDFPPRPTMWPALEQSVGRFADDWAGSIGE